MISKLLVANRGEIASRIIRTARARDIATVAVFSDPDACAPYVTEADEAIALPGTTPAETYLRIERIVTAAQTAGADAVHPGYGFLSENAGFARACTEAGLTFVGPPAEAIEAMGSKVTAKALMARAGVPVLPGLTLGEDDELDRLTAAGTEIGFPLLVKASFGGGGRGMRIVEAPDELAAATEAARREAASAFGDGTVFLERYVANPRHIEVQILADSRGTVTHLFERECSIQRRYQKILEEAPSPAVDETLRAGLGKAAVAAGEAIGYTGAGTVEFVVEGSATHETGKVAGGPAPRMYFLEVNTRLQVEHPVTELVTGLDLVALQLRVADGEPLPPEVSAAAISGHAIEARLYAEDVPAGFLPASGTLHRFAIPELPGVRVDAGVTDGSVISPHYDPMLAKVIARGANRDEACRSLARALSEAELHGVATNRDLLVGILREDEFRTGAIDTGYLTRHDPATLGAAPQDAIATRLHALAAALAGQAERRDQAPVLATLPSGWRNVRSQDQHTELTHGGETLRVSYRIAGRDVHAEVDGTPLGAVLARRITPERVDLEVAGLRRAVHIHRVGETYYIDGPLGARVFVEAARFPDPRAGTAPGSLLAPMPGTVVRVPVSAGQAVRAGQAVIVLEAMKMEHTVTAPHEGTVTEIDTATGRTVDTGAVLAVVEPAEPEEGGEEES
jgi:acetyl/propionyl-CoA carboxylase alpha subunit